MSPVGAASTAGVRRSTSASGGAQASDEGAASAAALGVEEKIAKVKEKNR